MTQDFQERRELLLSCNARISRPKSRQLKQWLRLGKMERKIEDKLLFFAPHRKTSRQLAHIKKAWRETSFPSGSDHEIEEIPGVGETRPETSEGRSLRSEEEDQEWNRRADNRDRCNYWRTGTTENFQEEAIVVNNRQFNFIHFESWEKKVFSKKSWKIEKNEKWWRMLHNPAQFFFVVPSTCFKQ